MEFPRIASPPRLDDIGRATAVQRRSQDLDHGRALSFQPNGGGLARQAPKLRQSGACPPRLGPGADIFELTGSQVRQAGRH